MIVLNEKGFLTNERIANWTDKAHKLYEDTLKGKNKPSPKVRLSVEETLLRFREKYGDKEECSIVCYKNRTLLKFVISQQGDPLNPLIIDEDYLSVDILGKLDLRPRYVYKPWRRQNTVTIPVLLPARKNAMLINLGIAIVLAILTKMLVNVIPAEISSEYLIPTVTQLFKKMTTIFSTVATPLVFLAVINGITGLGDVVSFGKVGKKILLRMFFTYCMAMAVMVAIGSVMGLASASSGMAGKNVFSELLKLVLDMIPNNLVEPFSIDNDLQVIVLSIFIGVVMLGLGDKVSNVRNLLSQAGDIVNRMMMYVCKLLPLFVYLGVSDLLLGDRLNNVYKVSQIIILTLAADAVVIAVTFIRTLCVTKVPARKLLSAQFPSMLINLTTSSQVSAYPESVKCCRDKLGVDSKVVDFGLPLGIVVYMPNGAVMLGAMAWVLAAMNTGPLDVSTIIKIAFVSMVVAIAAPPIPGSAFAVMPILFSACGTDLSLMPLAVIVASTVGYLLPAMNGFCLQQEVLMSAYKSKMVDEKVMMSKD